MLTNKLIKKIPDPRNAKEHYQSFIRKKNTKSVKKSQIITYQLKTFDKANIVDIKSVITKHPKTSHKLSKAIRQAENVGSNSPNISNSDTKKSENFLNKAKSKKKTKREYGGSTSTYNVKILSSFNLELQLKDTESATKSKLIELLTQLTLICLGGGKGEGGGVKLTPPSCCFSKIVSFKERFKP